MVGVITLMLAVLFTALAVDSGRLWMQKRHLQTIADIASIQAARQLGCGVMEANIEDAAQDAADANGFDSALGYKPLQVEMVDVSTDANGVRQYTTSGSEAVYVQVSREVPASLMAGGLFDDTVILSAEAVSRADPAIAAFSAGSFAARIDTENSVLLNAILGDILGSSVSLDAVSYKGIAATNITLNELLKASGQVGGLESLLTTNMSLANLFDLYAQAVSDSGTADATARAAMQQLASAAVSSTAIKLGDVLDVTTPDQEAAGRAAVNVLSLVTTSALIANGSHALEIPLGVSVPGITSITGHIDVISPPQMAIGPPAGADGTICTSVTVAQVNAQADVDVAVPVSVLGLGLFSVDIDLSLKATIASGTASLQAITVGNDKTTVNINAEPGLATVKLRNQADTKGAILSTTILGVYKPIAELNINLPVTSSTQVLTFEVDHPAIENLPQTQTVSSQVGDTLEEALSNATISIDPLATGAIASSILSAVVTPIIKPLLVEIARVLLDPLLETLGIQAGGMDVTLEGLQMRQEAPLII